LDLAGLSSEDVAQFIEQVSGHAASPAAVQALRSETGGNPFFVSEFLRLLQSEGRLDNLDGQAIQGLAVPDSIRQMIQRRVDQLSEACRELLMVAGVIGRGFGLPLLARAAGGAVDVRAVTLD